MGFLIAAVVLVGILVLFDLVLTLGVIRRLRSHARLIGEALDGRPGHGPGHDDPDAGLLEIGRSVGDFTATTTSGREISRDSFPDGALVGFFSPHCDACTEQLPGFLGYAGSTGRQRRTLAVLQGTEREVSSLAAALTPAADVVIEPPSGPVDKAFGGIRALPTMCLVDADWRVVASGYRAEALADRT